MCGDDTHHLYLVKRVAESLNLCGLVVEPCRLQRRRLRQEGRYLDFIFAQYHWLRRKALGLDAYRRKYFKIENGLRDQNWPHLHTGDINDKEVVKFIESLRPDITLIMGISILGLKALQASGPLILNIHGGFLPYYRGNHCIFFALYERRLDRIGSTIHFVDKGIDTGDIVEQFKPSIHDTDQAETLYCRAEKMAVERLVVLLKDFEEGKPLPRSPQSHRGRLYLTRDRGPMHDLVVYGRIILSWLRRSKEEGSNDI